MIDPFEFKERKCNTCGKTFIPAPHHAYNRYDGKYIFCSYSCMCMWDEAHSERANRSRETFVLRTCRELNPIPIDEIGLTKRTLNRLREAGIKTTADVGKLVSVQDIPGCGDRSVIELYEALMTLMRL